MRCPECCGPDTEVFLCTGCGTLSEIVATIEASDDALNKVLPGAASVAVSREGIVDEKGAFLEKLASLRAYAEYARNNSKSGEERGLSHDVIALINEIERLNLQVKVGGERVTFLVDHVERLMGENKKLRETNAELVTACEATEVEEIALSWADSDVKTRRINELAKKGILSGPGPFIPGSARQLRQDALINARETNAS